MTTELITAITALDRSKEAADQGTLDEIKKQSDLYRTTMYKFADMLKSLNEQKTSLLGILVIPLKGKQTGLNGMITREPDHIPAAPSQSTDAISLIHEIEELDGTKQQLTLELIKKCSQQRDKYREGVYNLKDAIISCQETISDLERQLAVQARLPSTPPKSEKSHSSAPVSPETKTIIALEKAIEAIDTLKITSSVEKEVAFQNYTFLLFVMEKCKVDDTVDLESFIKICDTLDSSDELLRQSAEKALQMMDQKTPDIEPNWKSFFRSKETLDHITAILNKLRKHGKFKTDTISEIAILRGHALKILAHFFQKLKSLKLESLKKCNYSAFGFTTIGFLAGQLILAEKIYEKCIASYLKLDPKMNTSGFDKDLEKIKKVRGLFLALLEKSRFV